MKKARFNKMRLWLIALVVTIGIFVSGCTGGEGNLDAAKDADFKKGRTGLDVTILDNQPPDQILQDGRFRIGVKIHNKGAYTAVQGDLNIVGINDAWNRLYASKVQLPPIKGKSLSVPRGEIHVEDFRGRNIALPPAITNYHTSFWAVVRYGYETVAQTDVCINPQLLIDVKSTSDFCSPEQQKSLSSQGAPIAVTDVKQTLLPSQERTRIEYVFTVENVGDGRLVTPIQIDEAKLASRRLRCNRREITPKDLEENRNQVRCTLTEHRRSPYTSTLSIRLLYRYEVKATGEFTVKRTTGPAY